MVATRTISSVAATVTQATLIAGLKVALASAGLSGTPADFTDGSNNRFLVYTIVYNVSTYGTVYFWVQVTSSLSVSCRLATDYNSGTQTSTNVTTYSSAITFTTSSAITLGAINAGSEASLVYMLQSSTYQVIGVLRPVSKRPSWDEGIWPFVFHPGNNSFSSINSFSSTLSPYSNSTYNFPSISQLNSAATFDGLNDVMRAPNLFTSSSQGFVGKFGNDFGLAAASGMSRLNLILTATEKFLILPTSPSSSAFCINVDN